MRGTRGGTTGALIVACSRGLEVFVQIISLREPCYVQESGADIKHLPVDICERLFGWESACQGIEILVKEEVPNVDFYAIVRVGEEGITLAATGELGRHHYFIPWNNIVAVHGQITS